jgi:hypothetical protein
MVDEAEAVVESAIKVVASTLKSIETSSEKMRNSFFDFLNQK